MPKLINRLLLCALCSVFLSCARSTFVDDKDVVVTRLVDVALKIDFDDNAPRGVASKSGWLGSQVLPMGGGATKANALEQQVNDINVFFVRERHEATQDAGLVRHIYLRDVDLNDTVVLKNVYLGKYIMYIVANVGDLSQGGTVAYTARMIKDFSFNMNGLSDAGNGWAMRGLPMFSREVVEIKFEGDGVKPISGSLHFGVAKVKFKCNIDPELAASKMIYISSVALIGTAKGYMPFSDSKSDVETNQRLYTINYDDIDNKTSVNDWRYVFPNMAGSNTDVRRMEDRTPANAPVNSTYLYIRTTCINGGNKEIYGFFVYLGDQDVSSFDTRNGAEYDLNINIKGIDPANDPRISYLKVSGGTWSSSVRIGELTTMNVIIKAQNLKGQSLIFKSDVNPPLYVDEVDSMCVTDLRNIATPNAVIKRATHPYALRINPLVSVDSDNFEQTYVLGFTPLKKVNGNYPLKVSVSTLSGAATDIDTPAINIIN